MTRLAVLSHGVPTNAGAFFPRLAGVLFAMSGPSFYDVAGPTPALAEFLKSSWNPPMMKDRCVPSGGRTSWVKLSA